MYSLGFISYILPVLIIAGVIFFVTQSRRNGNGVNAHQVLISYFYFIIAASVITMVVGLIILLEIALSHAFKDGEITDSLNSGLILLGTGAVICILHVSGRRAVQRSGQNSLQKIRRVYVFTMLFIFGIAGLVSLPLALIETTQYYSEKTSYRHYEDPSVALATAIVFIPLWAYYLYRVLREVRARVEDKHPE
jgi:hypothetical protein